MLKIKQILAIAVMLNFGFMTTGLEGQTKRPVKKVNKPKPKARSGESVDHQKAYNNQRIYSRQTRGEHLDIKVTPPQNGVGEPGVVLVEVYNNSKHELGLVRFSVEIISNGWEKNTMTVTVDGMTPNWSTIQRVTIPGKQFLTKVSKILISNMQIYNANADPIKMKYYSDLVVK